eukprot:TRINITY_DN13927_c0_g1_i1.p1 TRINITY_DN13927_c0_g1~~TRINITY_DN13927_c0_g1_i1.p1  ORF type:complete len:356 (-),score=70.28 TRINITY_DN13927_c0_g1_i1:284-1351(-)
MRASQNIAIISKFLQTSGCALQTAQSAALFSVGFQQKVDQNAINQYFYQRNYQNGYFLVGLGVAGFGFFGAQRAYAQEAVAEDVYSTPEKLKGMPKDFTLYQYQICPFCNKVRAFLDYHNIPYKIVEVNPVSKAELKWSQYKKVPVLVMDEEQVNDSNAIISRLNAEVEAANPQKKSGSGGVVGFFSRKSPQPGQLTEQEQKEEEKKWREWVDTRFVRVLTANIYRTVGESWQTFSYITESGNFSWYQRTGARYFGTGLMYTVARGMPKKYNIEGDLRENLYNDANEFVKALGGRQFMGGTKPNLADLAIFGVIRAVTGTDTFNDLMKNSDILPWYDRMREQVGESAAIVEGQQV